MTDTRHTLVCRDSRELGDLPSESVHLVLTSPPYPMIEMWDGVFGELSPSVGPALHAGRAREAWELMHGELDKVWGHVARLLVPGGHVCVNVGDATRTVGGVFRLFTNHARVLRALEERGLDSLPAILWRKQTNSPNKFMGSGMLPGAYVTLEHEHILILRKGPPRAYTGALRSRRARSAYFWEERNTWFSDVWDFKGARQGLEPGGGRERSAAFPFDLAYRLIAMYTSQGETVMDPFVGTGTTSLAAIALGRPSLGTDRDPKLLDHAARRMEEGLSALNRWTRERLDRHNVFVREATAGGRVFAHRNAPHDTPVVTTQERELALDMVREIRKVEPGVYAASYRVAS